MYEGFEIILAFMLPVLILFMIFVALTNSKTWICCSASGLKRCAERTLTKTFAFFAFPLKISLKTVTPECFNRGSSPNSAWIPAKSMRE